jgi:hypothetical protein
MKKLCLCLLLTFIAVPVVFAGTTGNEHSKPVHVTNDLLDVFVTNQPIPEPVQPPEVVDYQLVRLQWESGVYGTYENWFMAFEQLVRVYMEQGWVPYGGISADVPDFLAQVMVKYE